MKIFLFLLISLMVISAVTPAPHPPPPIKGGFKVSDWIQKMFQKQKQYTQIKDEKHDGHPVGHSVGHSIGHSGGNSGGHTGGEITLDSIKQKNHISEEFSINSLAKSNPGQKVPEGNNKFIKDESHLVGESSSSHETSFKLSETFHDSKTKEASDNFGGSSNPEKSISGSGFVHSALHPLMKPKTSTKDEASDKNIKLSTDSKTKETSDNSGVSSNPGKSTNPFRQPEGAGKTGTSDDFNKLKRDNSHVESDDASNSRKDIPPNKITKTSSDSQTSQASNVFGKSSNLEKISREGDIGHSVSQSPIEHKGIEKKEQEKHLSEYFREEYEKLLAQTNVPLNKISKKSPESITKDDTHKNSNDGFNGFINISGDKNTKLSFDLKTKEADDVGKSSIMQKILPGFVADRYIPNNLKKSKSGKNDDTEKLLNDDIQNNFDHDEIPMDKISKTSSESETKDALEALGKFLMS